MATSLSLKGRALRYLAAREHSRQELVRKLAPHAQDEAEITRVLDELEQRGLLSAERYVASVVHRRAARFGAARIRQELAQQGIDPLQICDTLEQLKGTELERASEVWRKRFGEAPADAKELARQLRFLLARGFSGEIARQVIRHSGSLDDTDF
jgi:regulatory protein